MANVTRTIISFQDGLVLGQIVYNDNNRNVNQVKIVNNSAFTCYMHALEIATGNTQSLTTPPSSTSTKNVAGLKLDVAPDGSFVVPETYELYCRWPG